MNMPLKRNLGASCRVQWRLPVPTTLTTLTRSSLGSSEYTQSTWFFTPDFAVQWDDDNQAVPVLSSPTTVSQTEAEAGE